MKLLPTTIAAVVLVGCATTQQEEPPTAKAPDISIHDAAMFGNLEAVKQHIAAGSDVNAKNDDLFTPLHYAATKEVAELLLANGADVNAKDNGVTPLHYAAGAGRKEIVELLITEGADVNAKLVSDGPHKGKTPLNAANEANHPEIADLLRKHGGKTGDWLIADKSIHKAASAGHIEAVKQHLAAGADVNAKNKNGGTPLHYASFSGCKEVAELLIAKGADVNAKNEDGEGFTPLDMAVITAGTSPPEFKTGLEETVKLLRKQGGISGAADSINVAAAVGNTEAVKQHLAAGVDVNAKTDYGYTPLIHAVEIGNKEIVELLIAEGADVNAKDKNGGTPLFYTSNPEIADLLRNHGGKTGEELKAEGK